MAIVIFWGVHLATISKRSLKSILRASTPHECDFKTYLFLQCANAMQCSTGCLTFPKIGLMVAHDLSMGL